MEDRWFLLIFQIDPPVKEKVKMEITVQLELKNENREQSAMRENPWDEDKAVFRGKSFRMHFLGGKKIGSKHFNSRNLERITT